MLTKVRLFIGIGALLAVVAVTVLFERLFRLSNRQWGPAVEAMLGLVIAAATVAYATLSYQLLQAVQRGPREAGYRQAAAAVATLLTREAFKVRAIAERFPIETSGKVPETPFSSTEEYSVVRSLANDLESRSFEMPPHLATQALLSANRLLHLGTALLALDTVWDRERREAEKTGSEVTWSQLKACYYTDFRNPVFSAEWEDLTSGRIAKEAYEVMHKLHQGLSDFMLGRRDDF